MSEGKLILVEDKDVLMRTLGKKQLTLTLRDPLDRVPEQLADLPLSLSPDGGSLVYTFDTQQQETGIASLLRRLSDHGVDFKDLNSSESSLEDIFVRIVQESKPPLQGAAPSVEPQGGKASQGRQPEGEVRP
jgi:ABC-2 type transport system ATP-binding protein